MTISYTHLSMTSRKLPMTFAPNTFKDLNPVNGNILLFCIQDEVTSISPDLLKLGLVHGTHWEEEATLQEEPRWLAYPHRIFQEYWAAYYASQRLVMNNSKVNTGRTFNSSLIHASSLPEDPGSTTM